MKIASILCLYTVVSPSLPEMEGIHAIGGEEEGGRRRGDTSFLVYAPCIYSHGKVELLWAIRVSVVASLVCRTLLNSLCLLFLKLQVGNIPAL